MTISNHSSKAQRSSTGTEFSKTSAHFPPKNLEDRIIATLSFFDLFDHPLTLQELEEYLLGEKATLAELIATIEKSPSIEHSLNYIYLQGREEMMNHRFEKQPIADNLWKKVDFYLPFLEKIPFIENISVTNTLAFGNPKPESDIDLFIIAKKNRLYTARFFTTITCTLLGARRYAKKVKGRFCLCFFLSQEGLNLNSMRKNHHDIYLAYWFKTLQPIFGAASYIEFIQQNPWLQEYFPHSPFKTLNTKIPKQKVPGKLLEKFLNAKLGDLFESFLEKYQQKRHQRNLKRHHGGGNELGTMSDIVINKQMLKFHNVDRREKYQKEYFEKIEGYLENKSQ